MPLTPRARHRELSGVANLLLKNTFYLGFLPLQYLSHSSGSLRILSANIAKSPVTLSFSLFCFAEIP